MKYKTFVALRAGAAALFAAGIAFVGCRAVTSSSPQPAPTLSEVETIGGSGFTEQTIETPETRRPAPEPKPAPAKKSKVSGTKASVVKAGAKTEELTTWQREVIDMQKQPLTNGEEKSGSRKWVVNGGGMRAEFRADTDKGFTYWNRAKIDLNQNKQDDERWDFKSDGSIKRRVSPGDDGNYTEEYRLQGDMWVKKG